MKSNFSELFKRILPELEHSEDIDLADVVNAILQEFQFR